MTDPLFFIENEAGTILIDDITPNIHLVAKGQHSTATNASPAPIGTRSNLQLAATTPILAFRPTNPNIAACLMRTSIVNGLWNFYFLATGGDNQTIDWWLFDTVIPADGIFEIYDEAGNRTFSLSTKPFKPIASLVGSGTDNVTMDAPPGANYVAVQGAVSGRRQWDGGANGDRTKFWEQGRWDAVLRNGDGLFIRRTLLDRATTPIRDSPGPSIDYAPRNIVVVNVANL